MIINDTTASDILFPKGHHRGLDLSQRPDVAYAYGLAASPFPSQLLIPRSEWQARIKEMEETETRVSDLIKMRNIKPLNQESTNFCWCNAVVGLCEIIRAQQNQRHIVLSPASAAAKITKYRNIGGWGLDAIKFISANGLNSVEDWPANAIDRRYDTEQSRAAAFNNRVDEWIECQPKNLDQLMSLLLRRIPVAVGYLWWQHEVYAADPVWIDGEAAIRIRNSWGNWGDGNGFGIIQGARMLADDAVAATTMLAT